jgi:hypothetical protein
MLKTAFRESLSRTQTFNTIQSGVISVNYDNHSGHPCTRKWMRTRNKWNLLQENRHVTIHNFANEVGIFIWIIPKHSDATTKNAMDCRKICALKKQNHVNVSEASSKSSERPTVPFDGYHQWQNMGIWVQAWNEAAVFSVEELITSVSKEGQTSSFPHNDCVFCTKRIVHHKFTPQGQTVNKHFYSNVLQHLKEDKFPVKWTWMLSHTLRVP